DLLVVPALLWKPTRRWALLLSFGFHLFNGIVFRIGTFPFVALGLNTFFFPGKTFDRIIKPVKNAAENIQPGGLVKKILVPCLGIYMLLQLLLPVRHHFIEGNVNWTEEGHRMSWRMMLRSKSGRAIFKVVDKESGQTWYIRPQDKLPEEYASDI